MTLKPCLCRWYRLTLFVLSFVLKCYQHNCASELVLYKGDTVQQSRVAPSGGPTKYHPTYITIKLRKVHPNRILRQSEFITHMVKYIFIQDTPVRIQTRTHWPDRWKHYRPDTGVIAQEYSSANLFSLRFHYGKENILNYSIFSFF